MHNQLKTMRTRLENLRANSLWQGPSTEEKYLVKKISELLAREEMMAKQHSRVNCLREGDHNIGCFHAQTKERARVNKIKVLTLDDGSTVTLQPELEVAAINFYKALFTAQEETFLEEIIAHGYTKVSDEIKEYYVPQYLIRR